MSALCQMGVAHMRTDGDMGGQGALGSTPWTSSNRCSEHPLHWYAGLSSQWIAHLLGVWEQMWELSLLGCQAQDHSSRHTSAPLEWRQASRCGKIWLGHGPWRMSYRPLASNLATTNSTCWRPLVSRHSASHHRKLAWCNWHSPWKKKIR